MCRFFLLFVYICIDVGDSIIKSGKGWDPRRFNHQVGEGLGSPEIQSSSWGRVGIPGDSIIKSGKGWDPRRFNYQVREGLGSHLSWLTPPHLCASLWPISEFPLAYVMVFLVNNNLRRDVVVYFVDISGTVDHHCLNGLFINY